MKSPKKTAPSCLRSFVKRRMKMVSFLTSPFLTSCAESRPTNSKDNCFISIQSIQTAQNLCKISIMGVKNTFKYFRNRTTSQNYWRDFGNSKVHEYLKLNFHTTLKNKLKWNRDLFFSKMFTQSAYVSLKSSLKKHVY